MTQRTRRKDKKIKNKISWITIYLKLTTQFSMKVRVGKDNKMSKKGKSKNLKRMRKNSLKIKKKI